MGYPLDAKYDSRAPYNEKTKKVKVCVSVTFHKDIEVEVEGDYDNVTLFQLAEYDLENDLNPLYQNGWIEDEFEVIEDEY